jgi:hypothetical protein
VIEIVYVFGSLMLITSLSLSPDVSSFLSSLQRSDKVSVGSSSIIYIIYMYW